MGGAQLERRGSGESDWDSHKDEITSLYRDQNKTLKETMQIMLDEHNFTASAKMYKSHIRKWGIDKNMKAKDAIEIVRQQKARAAMGKSSVVYVRGRRIEPSKMQQYLHRVSGSVASEILANSTTKDEGDDDESDNSPPRVVVRTPSPDAPDTTVIPLQIDSPTEFKVPEECISILRNYVSVNFETGTWKIDARLGGPETHNSCLWLGNLSTAASLIGHGRVKQGFHLLGICLDQYKLHVQQPDSNFWLITYCAIMSLSAHDPKLSELFLGYASKIVSVVLPPSHPFNLLWSRLLQLSTDGLKAHAPGVVKSIVDTTGQYITLFDANRSNDQLAMYYRLHWVGLLSAEWVENMTEQSIMNEGSSEHAEMRQKARMAEKLHSQQRAVEAEVPLKDIEAWLKTQPKSSWPDLRMEYAWEVFLNKMILGEMDGIEQAARDLYEFCMSQYGPGHYITAFTMAHVEACFVKLNNTVMAGRIRRDFDAQWKLLCKKARGFKKDKPALDMSPKTSSPASSIE